MEQKSNKTLPMAAMCGVEELVNVTLSSNQLKQVYLALNIFQAMYTRPNLIEVFKDLDVSDGVGQTLDFHCYDIQALKLDAKSYLSYVFDEIRQQLDQGIIAAEKMERSYVS